MSGLFIVAAKRTPFGAFGGSLKALTATDLGVVASKAALAQAPGLDPAAIDTCYFGNVVQSSQDAAYLARHVALRAGCSQATPALTINRLCGSGFETVIQGATAIKVGDAKIALCGGAGEFCYCVMFCFFRLCPFLFQFLAVVATAVTHIYFIAIIYSLSLLENMSMAPLQVSGIDARWGVALGKGLKMGDSLWDGLTDAHAGCPMGITAENLAEKYNISRQACDEYAIRRYVF